MAKAETHLVSPFETTLFPNTIFFNVIFSRYGLFQTTHIQNAEKTYAIKEDFCSCNSMYPIKTDGQTQ